MTLFIQICVGIIVGVIALGICLRLLGALLTGLGKMLNRWEYRQMSDADKAQHDAAKAARKLAAALRNRR